MADAFESRGLDVCSGAVEAGAEKVAGYFEGTRVMAFPLNEHGVPPCWRAYFLLAKQKKVRPARAKPSVY